MTRDEKSQETRKNKQTKDFTDTHHKITEFDNQEEKMRDISFIHRDIQMRFLKNKKENMGK